MISLNTDLEAGLGRPSGNSPAAREDQAQLLEPVQPPEASNTTLDQVRNSFDDSRVCNLLTFSVPVMKIMMAVGALIPGDYACFSTKQLWLIGMIGHDIFHAYVIWVRFQASSMMSRLGLSGAGNTVVNNANNNENDPNARDLQMNEIRQRDGPVATTVQQIDQEDAVMIPVQNSGNEGENRAARVQEWMEMKAKAQKLNKLCTYIWMMLFLFWLEMDAIQEMGPCDSKKINDTIMSFIVLGWLWLLNPIVICLAGCMCLPVFIILVLVFRKRNQTPATRNEIKNLPVKDYTPDLAGDHECAICIANYAEGDKIIQLECSAMHHFHEECLKSWLKINGQCPTCRARIGERR